MNYVCRLGIETRSSSKPEPVNQVDVYVGLNVARGGNKGTPHSVNSYAPAMQSRRSLVLLAPEVGSLTWGAFVLFANTKTPCMNGSFKDASEVCIALKLLIPMSLI